MPKLKIITTEDGSHSLYNEELKETYHSFHGALRESLYVFIDKGLRFFRTKEGLPKDIKIFEVGFGTGLNALLAAQFAKEAGISISYHSIEPFPLEKEIYENLNYSSTASDENLDELFMNIHESKWGEAVQLNECFSLLKEKKTFQDLELKNAEKADVLFFDAFAPSKQADMWGIEIIEKCFNLLKSKGVFVTYSARGQLKRDLKNTGFEIETVPGPPGKKEMVRAIKN